MIDLQARFDALDAFVTEHAPVWRARPFFGEPVGWESDHPGVAAWLRALPDDAVDALHDDPAGLRDGPPALRAWVALGDALTALPLLPPGPARHPEVARSVGGRKWEQVAALAAAAPRDGVTRWVDWCAGKSHLGRALGGTTGLPVLAAERQAALCADAEALAARLGVTLRAEVRDVLVDPPAVRAGDGLVALHACGALTDHALRAAADAAALAVAPCCPHFRPGQTELDTRSALRVHPGELRFATAEEVVAPRRLRARRRREEGYRLGLDALLRRAGAPGYTHVRPVPSSWLEAPFPEFVDRVAARDHLALPAAWDPAATLAAGEAHAAVVARVGLARVVFRRAVELWVILDRALRLDGFRVSVARFVDRRATPRDVVIRAVR